MTVLRRRISIALLVGVVLAIPVATKWVIQRGQAQREADTRALIHAVLTQDADVAARLLDRGADPNAIVTSSSALPPQNGGPPQIVGPLLTSALRNGDVRSSMTLIAHGVNVNVPDCAKFTPLALALSYNMGAVVTALLEHGANTNARVEGETVLFYVVGGSNQNPDTIRLLLKYGADINARETGFNQTVLMRAANYVGNPEDPTDVEIVRLLLTAHPNLELRDMGGNTALRIAEKEGSTKTVQLLRTAGAKEYSLFPPIKMAQTEYAITDLGPGIATAINNRGEVVGVVTEGAGDGNGQILGQAFVWSRGHMETIKAFHGPSSVANDINDQGQVVGAADFSNPDGSATYTRHAFLWQNGVMLDLHPRTGWAIGNHSFPSNAVSINEKGEVAEAVNTDFFLWRSGHWQDFKTDVQEGNTGLDTATPVAMNNKGQIILYLQASGDEHAGLWNGGKIKVLPPPEAIPEIINGDKLNVITNYYAEAINDKGDIVGETDAPVLWSHGKVSFLPRLYHFGMMGSQMRPDAINNRGQIVGTVSDELDANHPEAHALLWQNGKVLDLNALIAADSGWLLEDARSINEAGQIVGKGRFHGRKEAFLLTPLAPIATKN